MKKKIAFILTVYVDGTRSIIEGSEMDKESGSVASLDDGSGGGNNPNPPPQDPQ